MGMMSSSQYDLVLQFWVVLTEPYQEGVTYYEITKICLDKKGFLRGPPRICNVIIFEIDQDKDNKREDNGTGLSGYKKKSKRLTIRLFFDKGGSSFCCCWLVYISVWFYLFLSLTKKKDDR